MNARQMYNWMKSRNCMYSDSLIRQKISELGSIKRWDIVQANDSRFDNAFPMLFNRVERTFMNENFETLIFNRRETNPELRFIVAHQTELQYEEPVQSSQIVSDSDTVQYFSEDELNRINAAADSFGFRNRVLSYSHSTEGSRASEIYNAIGVLRDGDDDTSPTVGFELETQNEDRLPNSFIQTLDTRLGHYETDGSISGVEFDSHIFSWNKLKKCKPLFKEMIQKMSESGLNNSTGAGLHIHIGRNAFTSDDAFSKFFYLINSSKTRSFWEKLARRNANHYCDFVSLDENKQSVLNAISDNRRAHGISVNQEHTNTYEVRIFKSSFSTDIIYGTIEILLNLVEFCNSTKTVLKGEDLIKGVYARNVGTIVFQDGYNSYFRNVDAGFLSELTLAQLREAIIAHANRNDFRGVIQLINAHSEARNMSVDLDEEEDA